MSATLDLDNIRIDGGTQSRVSLNEGIVAEYADALAGGATMPPVVVFFDGSDHWLADGFHRYFAHQKGGWVEIAVDIRTGTKRDAVLYSVSANGQHGLRRSNADKRKAVETLLADVVWGKWSDREIARQCGVAHTFVASLRRPEVAAQRDANRDASAEKKVAAKQERAPAVEPGSSAAPAPAPSAQVEPGSSDADEFAPDAAEMAANAAAEEADRATFNKLLESDDKLAAAVAEVSRLNALCAQLQQRVNGLMTEKSEAIALCKKLQRQLDKVTKVAA